MSKLNSAALAVIGFAVVAITHARTPVYPIKPIRIVCPAAPGGPTYAWIERRELPFGPNLPDSIDEWARLKGWFGLSVRQIQPPIGAGLPRQIVH
jgi:hypothetical protein